MLQKTPTTQQITCHDLAHYLDKYLNPHNIEENANNGLQVENRNPITTVATAVSASLEAIEKAAALNASALIVHHGLLLKNDPYPTLTRAKYRKLESLLKNNIALLCYHLPLDAHREIGNNWKAAYDLGLSELKPFLEFNKQFIGVIGTPQENSFDSFKKRVETYYDRSALAIQVKEKIRSVAIVSGGAERFLADAAHAGADCLITGRVDEPVWDTAHEEQISFLGLGHYATETIGPKALAQHLQNTFSIPCTFIKTDNPF